MIKLFKYLVFGFVLVIIVTCKKKTSIRVKLFNPALNEYVANGTVVLVEKKGDSGGGIFSGTSSCKEVASAVTDANGECYFDNEKLRSNRDYFLAVKESWGSEQGYPCGGSYFGNVEKGGTHDMVVIDEADGYFQIQYNNLLNPSQQDDSLIVSLVSIEYNNPKGGVVQGNGGVFGNWNYYGQNGFPFPSTIIVTPIKTKGQRLKRTIRKRKMGIVTTTIDTVKVYPKQTTIIPINW
ncbi:MAG: hypothetical protein JNJ41_06895 [Bacteroidia bacterium]|nr:hypothetical protein [Bacteroidia bacterium]